MCLCRVTCSAVQTFAILPTGVFQSVCRRDGRSFPTCQAAEGQVPEGVEDVDAESKVELKGGPFEIRLISLIGDEKLVSVEPSSNIAELQKLAAEALNWERPWCIKFTQGSNAIATSSPETTLQELGLLEDCELMVLRREPWRRQNLGCSRYNNKCVPRPGTA